MALIEKRTRASGKPSYRVRVKYRGRVLSSTHTDRAKAERWAAETGAQIRDDAHFAGEGNRRRALADLIDRYVEHVLPGKRNARSQRRHLVWWRARIGHLPLANVTRAVIAQCRDELLTPHKGQRRGPATTVRYMASLSHVFTVAIGDWEWAEVKSGARRPQAQGTAWARPLPAGRRARGAARGLQGVAESGSLPSSAARAVHGHAPWRSPRPGMA